MIEFRFTCEGKNDFAKDRIDFRLEPVMEGSIENNYLFVGPPKGMFRLFSVNPEISEHIQIGKEYIVSILPEERSIGTCKLMKRLLEVPGVEGLPDDSIEELRRIICGEHNGSCDERYSGIKNYIQKEVNQC
ncbi:MAG: hypothetical protein K0Q47_90 [Sedimentibacter sp.]|jgi:hypothetical protein|nr:hypothetical protein [Sedimentibacter sp.]